MIYEGSKRLKEIKDRKIERLAYREMEQETGNTMRQVCPKCGEVFHYAGRWHPDQGELICSHCLGVDYEPMGGIDYEAAYTGAYGEREVSNDDDED